MQGFVAKADARISLDVAEIIVGWIIILLEGFNVGYKYVICMHQLRVLYEMIVNMEADLVRMDPAYPSWVHLISGA